MEVRLIQSNCHLFSGYNNVITNIGDFLAVLRPGSIYEQIRGLSFDV